MYQSIKINDLSFGTLLPAGALIDWTNTDNVYELYLLLTDYPVGDDPTLHSVQHIATGNVHVLMVCSDIRFAWLLSTFEDPDARA